MPLIGDVAQRAREARHGLAEARPEAEQQQRVHHHEAPGRGRRGQPQCRQREDFGCIRVAGHRPVHGDDDVRPRCEQALSAEGLVTGEIRADVGAARELDDRVGRRVAPGGEHRARFELHDENDPRTRRVGIDAGACGGEFATQALDEHIGRLLASERCGGRPDLGLDTVRGRRVGDGDERHAGRAQLCHGLGRAGVFGMHDEIGLQRQDRFGRQRAQVADVRQPGRGRGVTAGRVDRDETVPGAQGVDDFGHGAADGDEAFAGLCCREEQGEQPGDDCALSTASHGLRPRPLPGGRGR